MLKRAGFLVIPLVLLVLTPLAATAAAETTVQTRQESQLGIVLTDSKGMTLYQYRQDSPNHPTCYGGCAAAWPPLLVSAPPSLAAGVSGQLGTIRRTDGTHQVTYNGIPLYTYAADRAPGDSNGQGIGGVWYVVNAPSAAAIPSATVSAVPTPSSSTTPASVANASTGATQLPATGGFPIALVLIGGSALVALGIVIRRT